MAISELSSQHTEKPLPSGELLSRENVEAYIEGCYTLAEKLRDAVYEARAAGKKQHLAIFLQECNNLQYMLLHFLGIKVLLKKAVFPYVVKKVQRLPYMYYPIIILYCHVNMMFFVGLIQS